MKNDTTKVHVLRHGAPVHRLLSHGADCIADDALLLYVLKHALSSRRIMSHRN